MIIGKVFCHPLTPIVVTHHNEIFQRSKLLHISYLTHPPKKCNQEMDGQRGSFSDTILTFQVRKSLGVGGVNCRIIGISPNPPSPENTIIKNFMRYLQTS